MQIEDTLEIPKIPSRVIPWKKLFVNFGLGTAGVTGAGVLTTAKVTNEQLLTAEKNYERSIEKLDTKHVEELREKDKEVEKFKQFTPSAQQARLKAIQQVVDFNESFYKRFGGRPELYRGRRGRTGARAVHDLCRTTDTDKIYDPKIAQYCRELRK